MLVEEPDKRAYSVAGIHVGNQAWQGRSVAVAVSAETIWHEIRPCIEAQECYFQHFAGGKEPTAAEIFADFPNVGLGRIVDFLSNPPCGNGKPDCGGTYTDTELSGNALPPSRSRTKGPNHPPE